VQLALGDAPDARPVSSGALTAFVGQIRMATGDIESALTLFADALDLARGNGELFYVAEIQRLTAEAWLAQPAPDNSQAERYLLETLETSRRQGAKFCELRATSALPRLWSSKGRQTERYRYWLRSTAGSRKASTRAI
jgi:predicted ATPase